MTAADEMASEMAASIVIPAHNEAASITRLLEALLDTKTPAKLEIIVVCNGCTDQTAEIARHQSSSIIVLEIPEPSKQLALRAGDAATQVFPRVYVDADVEISGADVIALIGPLNDGTALATAPRRVLPRDGVSWIVRGYYDVWERLPQVATGLFGRGVIALSHVGKERVDALPQVMSDDLVLSEAFTPHERVVVNEASVIVRPPKTVGDLLRRRIRVATGTTEAQQLGLRTSAAATSIGSLLRLARSDRVVATRLPIFLAVTVAARLQARRRVRKGDFKTWLRDESSRGS